MATDPHTDRSTPGMFAEPTAAARTPFPTAAVGIAVVALLILGAVLFLLNRRHASVSDHPSAYASNLTLTNLTPSQAESLSGGRSTYVDGHIANHGNQTVIAATVQASFASESGQPQTQSTPLMIIRSRDPYVDTQSLAAAPLKPGAEADFRLIFENVSDAWNQQTPELKITSVSTQ